MNWKAFVSGYLTFSRKDRLGAVVLIFLIVLVYLLPYLVPVKVAPPLILNDSLAAWTDSSNPARVAAYRTEDRSGDDFDYNPAPSVREPDYVRAELFTFDPNTLDADGWRRLGLRDKTVATILKYRSKGGKFYKKEDLQRIWSLPDGFYERVSPYISIVPPRQTEWTEAKPPEPRRSGMLDINSADTAEWIALPGIGAKLASRIVNFRAKLGGFVSVEQVGSTYGLPDSTFQAIKPLLRLDAGSINKLNVNTATREELAAHPYINWKLAGAIIAYREQHGPYQTLADLKQIMILDEATWLQIQPYLRVQ